MDELNKLWTLYLFQWRQSTRTMQRSTLILLNMVLLLITAHTSNCENVWHTSVYRCVSISHVRFMVLHLVMSKHEVIGRSKIMYKNYFMATQHNESTSLQLKLTNFLVLVHHVSILWWKDPIYGFIHCKIRSFNKKYHD